MSPTTLFDKLIEEECAKQDMPFAVVKAIIEVESNFNPAAIRKEVAIKDASRGLMQILYRTAKGIQFDIKPEDLFDPYVNIRIGTTYLKRQFLRYGGRIWHGVSAYNAGNARVVTKPTVFCLARDQETGECIREFTAQPGDFTNQPYVDKVRAAMKKYSFDDVEGGSSSGPA